LLIKHDEECREGGQRRHWALDGVLKPLIGNFDKRGIIKNHLNRDLGNGGACGIPILKGCASQSLFKSEEAYRKTENWDTEALLGIIGRIIQVKSATH
jgi:hypothetical protein